ncbi:MAG: restriction endonuclease, partial [bacterium]|nr:restriction endonuclease [bacterium]
PEQSAQECETPQVDSNGIITTEEEIEGYNIVKAIAREVVDVHRITLRDNKSYCSILLDNNNRKPICRLHLNGNKKYITLFNDKMDEKISIDSIDDLFKHASKIKSTALGYDETNKTQGLTPPLTEETKFPS